MPRVRASPRPTLPPMWKGSDAANKLTILMASTVFDKYVAPEDIPTTGITQITKEKIEEARANNCKIKLIARAKKLENGEIEYEVRPMHISETHPLANINKEFNAVFVKGNAVDDLMFHGKAQCLLRLQEAQFWATL